MEAKLILPVYLLVAEERHVPVPGLGLVPGADQGSGSKAALQPDHQPAGRLQHVQSPAAGGAVHSHTAVMVIPEPTFILIRVIIVICFIIGFQKLERGE